MTEHVVHTVAGELQAGQQLLELVLGPLSGILLGPDVMCCDVIIDVIDVLNERGGSRVYARQSCRAMQTKPAV